MSPRTSGSVAAPRTNASKLVANDSYGWWTRRSARLISSKNCAAEVEVRDALLRHRSPRFVLEVRAVDRRQLTQVGELQQAADRIELIHVGSDAAEQPRAHLVGHRIGDLDAHDFAEPPPAELQLERFEQVVRLVGDLEVGIACNAERGAFRNLHLREERGEEMSDDLLDRHVHRPISDLEEARQELRDLDPREALLAGLGVTDEQAEREREPGDVGERLTRTDRERREHRIDLPLVELLQLLELVRTEIVDSGHDDLVLLEGRAQLPPPKLRLASGQLGDDLADLREGLECAADCRRHGYARGDLSHQAGDSDHEELVQIRGVDPAELDSLEQREIRVLGELEHARVEVQPRDLSIEEAVGFPGRGRNPGHYFCSGSSL